MIEHLNEQQGITFPPAPSLLPGVVRRINFSPPPTPAAASQPLTLLPSVLQLFKYPNWPWRSSPRLKRILLYCLLPWLGVLGVCSSGLPKRVEADARLAAAGKLQTGTGMKRGRRTARTRPDSLLPSHWMGRLSITCQSRWVLTA